MISRGHNQFNAPLRHRRRICVPAGARSANRSRFSSRVATMMHTHARTHLCWVSLCQLDIVVVSKLVATRAPWRLWFIVRRPVYGQRSCQRKKRRDHFTSSTFGHGTRPGAESLLKCLDASLEGVPHQWRELSAIEWFKISLLLDTRPMILSSVLLSR